MATKHGLVFGAKQKDSLQSIHDHSADLGADCGDNEPTEKHFKHGAFSTAESKDKVQAMHDHTQALGAACGVDESEQKAIKAVKVMMDSGMDEEAGEAYARQELWDIQTAASALISLTNLSSEMDEPDDAKEVAGLMRGILTFISGEIDEMESAATGAEKNFAQVKQTKSLDLSYAKSLGLALSDDELRNKLAVKFVGRDEIKGYMVLWGNPKLVDVENEYFTKDTNFWDDVLGATKRSLTWDHAQDKTFQADPRIGIINETGDDEIGRWYAAKLDESHRYHSMISGLIEQKIIGTSSDSAPQYVERVKNGKSTWLKTWPLFAAALTNIPAEPRMLGSVDWKSMGIDLSQFQAPDTAHELTKDVLHEASLLVTLYSRR